MNCVIVTNNDEKQRTPSCFPLPLLQTPPNVLDVIPSLKSICPFTVGRRMHYTLRVYS